MSSAQSTPPTWAVVVPVKRLEVAKTRLSRVAGPHRGALASAFAVDTVAAALQAPGVAWVLVVTDEPEVSRQVRELGAQTVLDVPAAGLNPALVYGAAVATRRSPELGVAALSADLPALRPAELGRALAAALAHPVSFVSDAEGTGTTLLAARPGEPFQPQFGHRSRAAHRAAGAVEITLDGLPTLHRDVDTEVDLVDARRLGVGPLTEALVSSLLDGQP